MIAHHFTVDVEEYFHPTALAPWYPMDRWDGLVRRSPEVIPPLLDLLAEHDVRGTFFVLGWLAECEPGMVRAIGDAGHEVASHGYEHELVGRLGQGGFRSSIARSKKALEDLVGQSVLGYRAPSFSIVPGLEWAFDTLLEEGYRYDASIFPVATHPTYGYPADRHPFWIERDRGALVEFPATTVRWFGSTLPSTGGAYFRFFPYWYNRSGLRQAERNNAPGMFYIHPWELDDWTPEVPAPRLQKIRTFHGRSRVWPRIRSLIRDFRFTTMAETVSVMAARRDRGPAPSG